MGRRPRLLLIITLAEVGGAQTYVANLLPALAPRFDVVVAAYGPGPLREAVAAARVRFVPLRHVRRPISPWRDALGLIELFRLCRRVRPDVVHLNSSKAGVLGCVAAAASGVPIRIFTVNGWAFHWYSGLRAAVYLWGDRLIGRLATRIVCVAEKERQLGLAARTCSQGQAVVIHNAVDVGAIAEAAHDGAAVPTVISVGRFKEPKDFSTLLQALARLPSGSFRALLVGDGPERTALEAEMASLGVRDVELLGERSDVPELLARSDIFVLSSRSEGLPLSILEAMAAGLPVVASAVGGVPELVADGETGALVPPGDVDALATTLESLVLDRERRNLLGRSARRRAEQQFDLPRFHAAHLDLYGDELAARGLPLPA